MTFAEFERQWLASRDAERDADAVARAMTPGPMGWQPEEVPF